jgi:hypothetical protein
MPCTHLALKEKTSKGAARVLLAIQISVATKQSYPELAAIAPREIPTPAQFLITQLRYVPVQSQSPLKDRCCAARTVGSTNCTGSGSNRWRNWWADKALSDSSEANPGYRLRESLSTVDRIGRRV